MARLGVRIPARENADELIPVLRTSPGRSLDTPDRRTAHALGYGKWIRPLERTVVVQKGQVSPCV